MTIDCNYFNAYTFQWEFENGRLESNLKLMKRLFQGSKYKVILVLRSIVEGLLKNEDWSNGVSK